MRRHKTRNKFYCITWEVNVYNQSLLMKFGQFMPYYLLKEKNYQKILQKLPPEN